MKTPALPLRLAIPHFDHGVECVSIIDHSGRTIDASIARDDAQDLIDLANQVPALRAALEEMASQFGHYCEHAEDENEVAALRKARAALQSARE